MAAATYPVQHDGWDDLDAGDVTGDGRPDMVVMSGQGLVPNVSVLEAFGNGTFGAAAEYAVGGNELTRGIGVGDVTGDGRSDVVASYGGNSPTGRLAMFAQSPAGTLVAPPISYQSYDIPGAVEVSDVDRDGRPDAVVVHEGWLRVGLYRGQAGGQLGGEDLYPVPHSNGGNPHGLAVGDVTGDGWPDIVIADDLHGLVILPNVGLAAPPAEHRRRHRASHSHRPRSRRPRRHRPRRLHPRPSRRPRQPRRPPRRRHPSRSRRARTWPPASA